MKTLKLSQVITANQLTSILKKLKTKWGFEDEILLVGNILDIINTDLRNYEIAYADPNEFLIQYTNIIEKWLPVILNRARFVMTDIIYLKDISNWTIKKHNEYITEQGYNGFNAGQIFEDEAEPSETNPNPDNTPSTDFGTFAKQKATNTNYAENPIIFSQTIIDSFADEMTKIKNEIKQYLFLYY